MNTDKALNFARWVHSRYFMSFSVEIQESAWRAVFDTGAQTYYGYGGTVALAINDALHRWEADISGDAHGVGDAIDALYAEFEQDADAADAP